MIAHTYTSMPPTELESFSALVTTRLENNALLSPIKVGVLLFLLPPHLAFSAAKLDYDKFGGEDRKNLLASCREDLVKKLYLGSVKVEDLAQGNAEIITASGYVLRKTRSKNQKKEPIPVVMPTNFMVLNDFAKTGYVHLSWNAVKGARTYGIELRLRGETAWKNGDYTSKTFIDLSGFPPDSIVEFRIRTIGEGEDKSEWTAVVAVLVT